MLFVPVLGLALAALPSCGSYDAVDYCDDKCSCKGCSTLEYDICVQQEEDRLRSADIRNCLDYYDDFMSCRETTECLGGAIYDDNRCNFEQKILNECVD
jgi:hypothetical protein